METNLAKFKHFVECYRLLIIEKNRFVGNIVNQLAYYLSKNPETASYAETLLNDFYLYEGADLTILDEYNKMIELQEQRILDFPHIFNEYIKTKLDLSSALAQHDILLSQQGSSKDIEAILFSIVPFYIGLFTTNFEMINSFVSAYITPFLDPLQNQHNMQINIDLIQEAIRSKKSKLDMLQSKIIGFRKKINDLDAKIRAKSLNKERTETKAKQRPSARQDDDKGRDKVIGRKIEATSSNDLKKLKIEKSSKLNDFDILIAQKKELQDELQETTNLLTLSRKLGPELEKYRVLNAYINELYWRPNPTPTLKDFQQQHVITPPIFIGICKYFNDVITDLTKQKKKNTLLTTISKINTQISSLKTEVNRPKNTQRARETEQERGREQEPRKGKKSSRDKRASRRSRSRSRSRGRSRGSLGKKDTNTAARVSANDIKSQIKDLKDLKEAKLSELARMNGGKSIIERKTPKNKPKDKESLSKYKLRVEQYKNKELSPYFIKKLRGHIDDPAINIYTIGINKMKEILKNIYNITK
jgi:hypothetical protein